MPMPSIAPPFQTPETLYVVSGSDAAYFDIELRYLSDGAELQLTVPDGADVHAWGPVEGETELRWGSGGIEQPLLTGGSWQRAATVGDLEIEIETARDRVATLKIRSYTVAQGHLRIRVRGIRADGEDATAAVRAGANAATRRVLADPTITANNQEVRCNEAVTMDGRVAPTVEQDATVPVAFGAVPNTRCQWSYQWSGGADPVDFNANEVCRATFTAPDVEWNETMWFKLYGFYDLDDNVWSTPGDHGSTRMVVVFIETGNPPPSGR